jgi:hypothetical protein
MGMGWRAQQGFPFTNRLGKPALEAVITNVSAETLGGLAGNLSEPGGDIQTAGLS